MVCDLLGTGGGTPAEGIGGTSRSIEGEAVDISVLSDSDFAPDEASSSDSEPGPGETSVLNRG